MSSLLILLPFCADDSYRAEALCDWIYAINGKTSYGNCLLCPAADVHEEMRIKVKISAALAFDSVEMAEIKPATGETKAQQINNLFRQSALHAMQAYRFPFLWLEPDAVPLKPDWIQTLDDAYQSQVKRFMGPYQFSKAKPDDLWLGRVAVYPHDAARDLDGFCKQPAPYERSSSTAIVPRSSKSRLIQYGSYDGEQSKVRPDAVLFHSDKTGALIETLRSAGIPDKIRVPVTQGRQTRPRKAAAEVVNGN